MEKLYHIFESHCAEYNIKLDGNAQTAVKSKIQDMVDHADGCVDLGCLDDLFRHVLSNRAKRTTDDAAVIIVSDVM